MAAYQVSASEVGVNAKQLAAGVEDTVSFPRDCNRVEVISDGAAALYFTVDGTAATVGGGNCYPLPAGGTAAYDAVVPTSANTVVRLISAGTPTYSVIEVK